MQVGPWRSAPPLVGCVEPETTPPRVRGVDWAAQLGPRPSRPQAPPLPRPEYSRGGEVPRLGGLGVGAARVGAPRERRTCSGSSP
jgi:hypothetical protein